MEFIDRLIGSISLKVLILKGNFDIAKMKKNAKGARSINEKLLFKILNKNKNTEYGRKYNFADIHTVEDFRRNVPIVEYDDLEEYVDRIYFKDEKNVLTKERIVGYAKSSGSISKQKRIPKTKKEISVYDKYSVTRFLSLANKYKRYKNGRGMKLRKGISLLLHDPTLSELGVPSSNIVDLAEKRYRILEPFAIVLPLRRQFEIGEIDENYAYARFGLEYKDLSFVFFVFAKGILEFIEYIRDNWQTIVKEIEEGTISESEKMDDEVRKKLLKVVKPNPIRAKELREEFEKGFDETIIHRIWPNLSVLSAIGTSPSFEGFVEQIKMYTKDIPFDYSYYAASEGLMAASYEVDNIEQLLLSDSCYYEFVEEEDDDCKNILSLDELEVGKNYEIIITNQSGFYRYRIKDVIKVLGYYKDCPLINFVYRKGQLLNIISEKTTVEHMNETMKRLSQRVGVEITDWAVTVEKGINRYRYAVYIENENNKDLSMYSSDLDEILSEVNIAYGKYKFTIEKPKIYNQKHGTHKAWVRHKVNKGAPKGQVKPVRNLDNEEKYEFFSSRVF